MSPRNRVEDIHINSLVRKVFARHLINQEPMSFRTVHGKVCVYGWLERLPLSDQNLNSDTISTMMNEVERISGVTGISDELENWERSGKGWVMTPLGKKAQLKGRPKQRIRGRGVSSFKIKARKAGNAASDFSATIVG